MRRISIKFLFLSGFKIPHHLHTLHNDYPLALQRITVTEKMLSPYARLLLQDQKFKGTPKLITSLEGKNKYSTFRNLKLYLQLGLHLLKIHNVLKLKQTPCLEKYMTFT